MQVVNPFRARGLFLQVVAAGLIAIAAASCGGGDDDDDDDNGDDDAETTATADATTPGGNGSTTVTETATPGSAGSPLDRLREASEGQPETYLATYQITGGGMDASFTIAAKPPRSLFAIEGTSDGEATNFVIIQDADYNYICSEESGAGQCIQTAASDDSMLAGLGDLLSFNATDELVRIAEDEGLELNEADGRTINGQDADCYEFSGADGDGIACVGEDSDRLLYLEATEEGEKFTYELTEYTEDVDDEEFEPPFPVVSIGG